MSESFSNGEPVYGESKAARYAVIFRRLPSLLASLSIAESAGVLTEIFADAALVKDVDELLVKPWISEVAAPASEP